MDFGSLALLLCFLYPLLSTLYSLMRPNIFQTAIFFMVNR